MAWYEAGGLLVGTILMLMAIRVPAAFAFLIANLVGVLVFIGGDVAIKQLVANATTSVTNFALVPVPLFILMGELFFHTKIGLRVFDVLDQTFGNIRGRLSYLTVGGGAIFAALSGSSIANTAMLGSTLLPNMSKRGYAPRLSMGPIIASGGLAIMIPPSALAILLGSIARINIAQMLMGGIIPGLMLAVFYMLVIRIHVWRNPDAAPSDVAARIKRLEKLRLLAVNLLPMVAVIFMVTGVIVLGIATPTEASAFGVLGVLIVAGLFRALTWQSLIAAVIGTTRITGMVFLIILGSSTFSQVLAFSGASGGLAQWVTGLSAPPIVIVLAMLAVLLVLGMLMESVSIMMLTVPIFFPLVISLGFDPIWFGIIFLLMLEIGLATPPFGMSLFVLLGVAPPETTMSQVVYASLPYIAASYLVAALLISFPILVTAIPQLMR